jgi:carbon monoxide dehydrogenase subunit G
MGTYSYDVSAESSAPPEVVFDILADGARWREWAGPTIRHSSTERDGTPSPQGVGAIKKLGSAPIFSREETVEYDRPRRYAYTIISGPPVRDYKAIVELTPHGAGTSIRWTASFDAKIPGTGALITRYFSRFIGALAQRLAKHAERVQDSGNRSTTS